MSNSQAATRLPRIAITEADFEGLSRLANAASEAMAEVAETLLKELERARIVSDRTAKPSVVRMGSSLTYRSDDGTERSVTLVYPADADISCGRISIMTPIGTALIGLSEGQSIGWTTRSNKPQTLTVVSVTTPTKDAA